MFAVMRETFILNEKEVNMEIIVTLYQRLGSKQNCQPIPPQQGLSICPSSSHPPKMQSSLFLVRAHLGGTDPIYPLLEAKVLVTFPFLNSCGTDSLQHLCVTLRVFWLLRTTLTFFKLLFKINSPSPQG